MTIQEEVMTEVVVCITLYLMISVRQDDTVLSLYYKFLYVQTGKLIVHCACCTVRTLCVPHKNWAVCHYADHLVFSRDASDNECFLLSVWVWGPQTADAAVSGVCVSPAEGRHSTVVVVAAMVSISI